MKSTEPSNNSSPILIFAYGNPSRGDDALGPAMFELLEKNRDGHRVENNELDRIEPDKVDLLTDYQLQIEHAIDLERRECVLFIDASVSASAPYEFHRLQAERDSSYTTHAMSPVAVLDVYQQINQRNPPPSYMLSIRGYEFGLGKVISDQANINLQQGYEFIKRLLATDLARWPEIQI
ncbi:MAG: hydrogenase maturation protease [Gammaproteobacteria bacterium]|nr:hydrogenase maturation protease [Gammaproteobacteria bacterium]